jgi:anti-sigma B factor antagonist
VDKPTEFSTALVPGNAELVVLSIRGFVDVGAAPALEAELQRLLAAGHHKLLLDLREVTYISSAGIGAFVGLLKDARAVPGGDIKLFGASPKVLRVFEAIGLPDMLDIFPQLSDAVPWTSPPAFVNHLTGFRLHLPNSEVLCGRPFRLRVEALDEQQRVLPEYRGQPQLIVTSGLVLPRQLNGFQGGVWEGEVTATDSGLMTLIAVDEKHEGRIDLLVREESERAEFPRQVTCRTCGTSARVKGMDIYRCAQCNEIFYVDAWAHVIPLKPGSRIRGSRTRGKRVDLKLNADVNYLNSIRRFIQGLCEQEGLDEVLTNAVVLTVEEVLLNLIEHSHGFDPLRPVALSLRFLRTRLRVVVRDYGDPYDITQHKGVSLAACVQRGLKGGVGGMLINQLMDTVAYRRFPHYNELVLTKRRPLLRKH